MKTTVIYHRADFDGIFCREIAKRFLPEAELIGWDHNDPKIPFPDGRVYVFDLAPDCFEALPHDYQERIIWIDHHKSSIEKWTASLPGYRIDGVAACRLAWQWFLLHESWDPRELHPPADLPKIEHYRERLVSEPFAVRLAGEYDIWDKRDERAGLFQHGLRSRELGDRDWLYLLSVNGDTLVESLLEGGKSIQYAAEKSNESIIKELGFTFQWEGLTWLVCNHARYNSHLFTAGLTPEHDACFGFKLTASRTWSISLYHAPGKEHHDLSVIAKKHGGGGHRGACGFSSWNLPFKTRAELQLGTI